VTKKSGFDSHHGQETSCPQCPDRLWGPASLIAEGLIFFNWYGGGGVQLGPLGTAATNRPIVPAPGDYDDGETGRMMIGKGNRSTRRKPVPVPLCPLQTPHALPGREPGPPRWEASD
jgi:hypothetical protein